MKIRLDVGDGEGMVEILDFNPTQDIVVIEHPKQLSCQEIVRIKGQLAEGLTGGIIVLDGGAKIKLLRKDEINEKVSMG